MRVFTDRLRATLTLASGGSTVTLPTGSLERLDVSLRLYGFEAEVTFRVSSLVDDDAVFGFFVSDQLLKVTLSFKTCVLEGTGRETQPIVVGGYVIERKFHEETSEEAVGEPIAERRYVIKFVDAAAAFWREHHPIELFVNASMQQVIEGYKTEGMELEFAWPRLAEKQDVLCVSAGAEGRASFYDLVVWYLAQNSGHMELDASVGRYRFSDEKQRAFEAQALEPQYVDEIRLLTPRPRRASTRVLNGDRAAPPPKAVENALAAEGVWRDVLVRTPIAAVQERRAHFEAGRLRAPGYEAAVRYRRCPAELAAPGAFVKLASDFSEALHAASQSFRVLALRLEAAPPPKEQAATLDDETAAFSLSLSMTIEQALSARQHLPAFYAPRYPVTVEGTIVSVGGTEQDRTWLTVAGESDSVFRYQIDVPLWNKRVVAPFEPGHMPGHFFFPAYKHQRVLVDLTFTAASVRGFVDWAANARVPLSSQGNRLALGNRAEDGMVIEHVYRDARPLLGIRRVFGADLQTIEVSEGRIFFEVKEDESALAIEPRHDVVVVVTASKARVSGEIEQASSALTGAFEASVGGVSARLDVAVEQLDASVTAAQRSLSAQIEAVDAQLQELSSSLSLMTEQLLATTSAAKAELLAALQ